MASPPDFAISPAELLDELRVMRQRLTELERGLAGAQPDHALDVTCRESMRSALEEVIESTAALARAWSLIRSGREEDPYKPTILML